MAGGSATALSLSTCSGFTPVTAHRLLNRSKRPLSRGSSRLPGRTVRQLPDQSTTLWVESSSTSDPRLRSALPNPTLKSASLTHIRCKIPASLRATATIAHNMLDRLTIRRPRARNTDHFLTRSKGLAAASHSASRTATRSKIHSAEVRSGVASFGSRLAVYGLDCRLRTSERSLSRKKLSKVRITATVARRTSSSQLGAIEVARISAASWKVRPATSQRA
jgi:hypothetical protein